MISIICGFTRKVSGKIWQKLLFHIRPVLRSAQRAPRHSRCQQSDQKSSFPTPAFRPHLTLNQPSYTHINCASRSFASLTPNSSPSSAARAAFIIRAVCCAEKSPSREETARRNVSGFSGWWRRFLLGESLSMECFARMVSGLTFSGPFNPSCSLPQGLQPLGLGFRERWIRDSGAAGCEEEEEAHWKVW
jgi:hypothetical protein